MGGIPAVLTKAWQRAEMRSTMVHDEVGRRRWGGARGPGGAGSSGILGCTSRRVVALKPSKGSERAEGHWWRENSTVARSHLT